MTFFYDVDSNFFAFSKHGGAEMDIEEIGEMN